jgi:phosphoglucomutase
MSGVNRLYTKAVFVGELGQGEEVCINSEPKDDFAGGHADPNLTCAKQLVENMGLDRESLKIDVGDRKVPSFGAAAWRGRIQCGGKSDSTACTLPPYFAP